MFSKFVCATLLAVASGHSLHTRDTSGGYAKVNRDSGYSAPAPSYNAPAPSYNAPAPSYSAPATSYGSSDVSYSAPSTGYGEVGGGGGLDLTVLIIPILALIGLSLLFPTFVSVSADGRKKRSAEIGEDVSPMSEVMGRVNDIYMSVVQSEECMERIACEVGGLAHDIGLRQSPVTKMMDSFVPQKYTTYYKQFKSGQNCQKIKCGSFGA